VACALVCATACRSAGSFPPGQPSSTSLPGDDLFNLQLTKAKLRADGASESLVDKISASAFRYFRAMAEPFKHRTCEAFRDLRWRLPSGPVHGDAHLEQFVVTDDDFGLADFDNAGSGPAIVDLVRYASSLHLACREIEGGCDPEQAVTAYFNAYHTALDYPAQRNQPEIVARLRGRLGPAPDAWLQWAESLMQPLARAEEERVRSE
jgi:thiamine kinase-like enzyme